LSPFLLLYHFPLLPRFREHLFLPPNDSPFSPLHIHLDVPTPLLFSVTPPVASSVLRLCPFLLLALLRFNLLFPRFPSAPFSVVPFSFDVQKFRLPFSPFAQFLSFPTWTPACPSPYPLSFRIVFGNALQYLNWPVRPFCLSPIPFFFRSCPPCSTGLSPPVFF